METQWSARTISIYLGTNVLPGDLSRRLRYYYNLLRIAYKIDLKRARVCALVCVAYTSKTINVSRANVGARGQFINRKTRALG